MILILHYIFDYFGYASSNTSNTNVDLQVQKYKTIIGKLTKEKEKDKEKEKEEQSLTSDYEDLELYLQSKTSETTI
jgi:hypothetical protein